MWLASKALKAKYIPEIALLPNSKKPQTIQNILIVNNYRGRNFSVILLKGV
jgi:hypothetical protein